MQALHRARARIQRISWRDLFFSAAPVVLVTAFGIAAAYWIVQPAPPRKLTITAGPEGSVFRTTAERYRKLLAANGVELVVLASQGSLENLRRLADANVEVDVGFVQAGVAADEAPEGLVSLGSVFYEPLAVFYRSNAAVERLSAFKGKRIAIGPEGSGTRTLALTLLKANGVTPETAALLDLGGDAAARALTGGQADAVFLMGDSATPPTMRRLTQTRGVRLMSFAQADAYTRRYPYLEKLVLPMGVLDLGANTPAQDAALLGPTVELVAREALHPALSDLLIEAAQQVHGRASVLQRAGQFPAPLEHEYPVSDEAKRYYKSGKSFLYRLLPFWLASLADRVVILLVPVVLLLLPGLRLLPWLYSWRIRSRIYRWYGQLIPLERGAMADLAHSDRHALVARLDEIEAAVNRIRVPIAYADQLYVLREHIDLVRTKLEGTPAGGAPAGANAK